MKFVEIKNIEVSFIRIEILAVAIVLCVDLWATPKILTFQSAIPSVLLWALLFFLQILVVFLCTRILVLCTRYAHHEEMKEAARHMEETMAETNRTVRLILEAQAQLKNTIREYKKDQRSCLAPIKNSPDSSPRSKTP